MSALRIAQPPHHAISSGSSKAVNSPLRPMVRAENAPGLADLQGPRGANGVRAGAQRCAQRRIVARQQATEQPRPHHGPSKPVTSTMVAASATFAPTSCASTVASTVVTDLVLKASAEQSAAGPRLHIAKVRLPR